MSQQTEINRLKKQKSFTVNQDTIHIPIRGHILCKDCFKTCKEHNQDKCSICRRSI